jgi:hypothetical protein
LSILDSRQPKEGIKMLQIAPHREAVKGMKYKVVISIPENTHCSIIPKAEQFPKFPAGIKVAIVIIHPTG